MKPNYTVKNSCLFEYDRVILVSNFILFNEVMNTSFVCFNKEYKIRSSIGIWKVKEWKNSQNGEGQNSPIINGNN